jgi:hypothetical protein
MLKRTGAGKRKNYDITAGVLDLRRPTVGILNSQPAVKHTFRMLMHACILRHHKRPKNMWLYILNVAVMPHASALHKHTYVHLADIYIMPVM